MEELPTVLLARLSPQVGEAVVTSYASVTDSLFSVWQTTPALTPRLCACHPGGTSRTSSWGSGQEWECNIHDTTPFTPRLIVPSHEGLSSIQSLSLLRTESMLSLDDEKQLFEVVRDTKTGDELVDFGSD